MLQELIDFLMNKLTSYFLVRPIIIFTLILLLFILFALMTVLIEDYDIRLLSL